ncbi:mammalian cell entry protein, partial [Nocardia salmonicida]
PAPQSYPAQLIPGWLAAAGPAPIPTLPALPTLPNIAALPNIPGLSLPGLVVPGITAPASSAPPPPGHRAGPVALTGPAAVAAFLGKRPNTTQQLLLGSVLTGATVTVAAPSSGGH